MIKKGYISFVLIAILSISCRKDDIKIPSFCNDTITVPDLCIGDYHAYSTDTFTFINQDFVQSTLNGFTYVPYEKYQYGEPVFNPNNPYEFAYGRLNTEEMNFEIELWVFSFCTGESNKIFDNASHNLDWSSKNWISFTANDGLIYKVKPNGDSLQSFPPIAGLNNAGKWNPSGTLIWSGANILDESGELVTTISNTPFGPKDWINDSTLLGWRNDNLFSMNIYDQTNIIQLNNNWTCATCNYIYAEDISGCYVNNGIHLIFYSLDGSNTADTISSFYPSYSLGEGDYMNGKRIHALVRKHWKDSLNDILYTRIHIAIMEKNGTDVRIVDVP